MDNCKSESTVDHDIKIGQVNNLAVTRFVDFGLVLRNHNGDQEVLLPNAYMTDDMKELGKSIEVFVYTDSEDRDVATTLRPVAMVGEIAYMKVVEFQSYGAFVDWGLPKDLFVPLSKQKNYLQIGKSYIFRVELDEQTDRVYASQKIGKYLEEPIGLSPSQKFDSIIIAQTPMGYKIVAENIYEGMLYDNEIFEKLSVGDRRVVYLKNIREDKKLDFSLYPIGSQAKVPAGCEKILKVIKNYGGKVEIDAKSSPESIEKLFSMSKKSFKASLNEMKSKGIVDTVNGWSILL